MLLKSARGLRWALPSEVLRRRAPPCPPPPPPSAPPAAAVGSTSARHDDSGLGRYTTVASPPSTSDAVAVLPPGALLLDAPAVAAVVGDAWLDRVCHFCLRAPGAVGGRRILE